MNNWWVPQNLKKNEELVRSTLDIDLLDDNNDFASYKKTKLGFSALNSNLHSHNDLNPKLKIIALSKILPLHNYKNILDAGCGVGITTAALADHCPKARVLGVDVSSDAVDYARIKFPKAYFEAQVIDPADGIIGKFDAIFCFEFYPFTRNSDASVQIQFIEYFIKHLNEDGDLVIYQTWRNLNSTVSIYKLLQSKCSNLEFKVLKMAHPKLVKFFPYFLALNLSRLLQIFFPSYELIRKVVVVRQKIKLDT